MSALLEMIPRFLGDKQYYVVSGQQGTDLAPTRVATSKMAHSHGLTTYRLRS
jgi:hypothetical protein